MPVRSQSLTDSQRELVEDAAYESELEVRESYSGRGMYGSACFGVSGSAAGFRRFLVRLAQRDAELAERLAEASEDTMGYGRIFYWPGLAWS